TGDALGIIVPVAPAERMQVEHGAPGISGVMPNLDRLGTDGDDLARIAQIVTVILRVVSEFEGQVEVLWAVHVVAISAVNADGFAGLDICIIRVRGFGWRMGDAEGRVRLGLNILMGEHGSIL